MKIGGFQKVSLIDFPSKVSAVIFTQGCNFRCPFCHNPELVLPDLFDEPINESYVLDFLDSRKGKLDGVVITGGEPTMHPGLLDFILKVKDKGFAVKLDTNGSYPDVLERIVKAKVVDYFAMDIKAPFEKYPLLSGVMISPEDIAKSIELIRKSGAKYQFRTTNFPHLLDKEDIDQIALLAGNEQFYRVNEYVKNEDKLQILDYLKPVNN